MKEESKDKSTAKDNNKSKRTGKRKRKKMMVFGVAMIVILLAVIFAFSSVNEPDPYTEVKDILKDPSKYNSGEIEVAGTVGNITRKADISEGLTFLLYDRSDDNYSIIVDAKPPIPDLFDTGKDVVVTGTLIETNGTYLIRAKNIQVGCPSKYD